METEARVRAASAEDLGRWLDGTFTAERLNDLCG